MTASDMTTDGAAIRNTASSYLGLLSVTRLPAMAMGLVATTISQSSFAQGTTALTGVSGGEGPTAMLQQICAFILGPFGQTLAVLGIIGIGLAWMFGRVSLGVIAGVIGGIIILFVASFLGEALTTAGGAAG